MIPAGMAAGLAVANATEACPHPESRARAVVVVPMRRGSIALCQACNRGFRSIIAQAEAGQLGPQEIASRVVEMGYSRRRAAEFVFGFYARRLRLRLGFREAA
jgi:hypothetical protein